MLLFMQIVAENWKDKNCPLYEKRYQRVCNIAREKLLQNPKHLRRASLRCFFFIKVLNLLTVHNERQISTFTKYFCLALPIQYLPLLVLV